MNFTGINNKIYSTGKELGKGGEGTVYFINEQPQDVLKVYNEPVSAGKLSKLHLMVSIKNAEIEKYAAWPVDVLRNTKGDGIGFVMRRLDDYYPVHMLFSPMDRKRLFPDKGYNFLVHVARNLASAFYHLHNKEIIVGDINENNILVNKNGLIAFIDCDSFQLKQGNHYYYCEVGIPRYTAPELLKLGSFHEVIRTINTDSFSLGILIFQLLFLGRHPFAGKNNSAGDLDEDAAIRNFEFAYSLTNTHKRLLPPATSFDIRNLPKDIIDLFHRSFEHEKDRPQPPEWIKALDNCLTEMMICKMSRTHSYPSAMNFCPWCDFKQTAGILYFWDDSYMENMQQLGDIDRFVNGFKLEKLSFVKLQENIALIQAEADPIDPKYIRNKDLKNVFYILIVIAATAGYLYFSYWALFVGPVIFLLNRVSPWSEQLTKEHNNRKSSYAIFKEQFNRIVNDYNRQAETDNYHKELLQFDALIGRFRQLPVELQIRRRKIEEQLYAIQLQVFLRAFLLKDNKIPMFGASKQLLLHKAGIITAADITRLKTEYVRGIGPKNIQYLESWKRQIASGFVYRPDQKLLENQFQMTVQAIANDKMELENQIKKIFHSLQVQKITIVESKKRLKKQYDDILLPFKKAEVNLIAFQKIVK